MEKEHARTNVEIMWGVDILDEGFTSIPNLLIRNYRKIGIEHGEFGFILNLLTYKHDSRDPYPSRELLADNLACSARQIDKWIKSLKEKKLIRTGRRRNVHNKQWDNTVYNLKPLIDTLLNSVGYEPLPSSKEIYEIVWDDEHEPTVPEVRMGLVPEVRMGLVPEVQSKITSKNNNTKNMNVCMSVDADADQIILEILEIETKKVHINDSCTLYDYYFNEIFAMLKKNFSGKLEPEVIKIACGLFQTKALDSYTLNPKFIIKNPTGWFYDCYQDAINQWKATRYRSKASAASR